jgi:hypothetical protein
MQEEAEPVGVEELEDGADADSEVSSIGFSSHSSLPIDAPRSTVSGNVRAPASNPKPHRTLPPPHAAGSASHEEEQFSADLFERLHSAK